jgi:hypothetical protein
MTFSYTEPDITTGLYADPKDEVRYLSADIVQTPYSATDEEIAYLLGKNNDDVILAAAEAFDRRADKYKDRAKQVKRVGDLQIANDYTQIGIDLNSAATKLRNDGATSSNGQIAPLDPGWNGDSFYGRETYPVFKVGMGDYRGAF